MSRTYVPPRGPLNAPYVFVGEQPGMSEVRRSDLGPFSGPAGRNLQECLHAAGILWSECYRTNVIKDLDAPLEHYVQTTRGKNGKVVLNKEAEAYTTVLRDELSRTSANIIVACGNIALWALTNRLGITSWRGSVVESVLVPGRKVIPIIHPATWTQEKLYSNPGAYLNRHLVIMDLKRARLESEYPEIRREPHKLSTEPTYHEALSFIDTCIQHGLQGATIDYDIEIQRHNQELSCIGLSHSPEHTMCIPFVSAQGDYFNPEQELEVMLYLSTLFADDSIRKRGQNVIFDSHYLLKKYGIRTHNLECTMVAQGILYPEFRKSLEFITSMWTDIPYYKRDGKVWLEGGTEFQRGWEYNCWDVVSCAVAHPRQIVELAEQGNLATYERQRKLIPPLTYMMEHGIRIDLDGMAKAAEECEQQIHGLAIQLSSIMMRDCIPDASFATKGKTQFNLSSPPQLCEYFYNEMGHKPYLDPDTHRPTVNVTALTRLANAGFREASLILKLRQIMKRKSTFLDTKQVDPDGRMRCQYNPVGTKFGRISSSENIFGTGTNLQNQPHDVLTYFVADPGYIIYCIDMSQIENRIVAYVGNILPLIQAFEEGLDSHRVTASLVLRTLGVTRPYEVVTSEERQELGKRPNHAFNYGYGYKSFSLRYEVPESDAKRIHHAYHTAYPGLRNSYWAYVEDCLKQSRELVNLYDRHIKFFGQWSDSLLNEARSAIPQSTCGDHVNERGIEFVYYNEDPDFQSVELLTQIHDSIDFQMPLSVPLSTHARVLSKIRDSLESPLRFRDREFVVPADLTIGTCLNKEVGIELKGEKFPRDLDKLESVLNDCVQKLNIRMEE